MNKAESASKRQSAAKMSVSVFLFDFQHIEGIAF